MAEPEPERYDNDIHKPVLRSVGAPPPSRPAGSDTILVLAITPVTSALAAARDSVRSFLRRLAVPEHAVADVVLSLEEACKNAIRFSGSSRSIDVKVALAANDICLVVRDHGIGFEPQPIDTAVPPDPFDPQGRGLFLMTCLMDDVRVEADEGAVVSMRKAVGAPAAQTAG
jgi:anti-sigma regulatory factor (Ser/Thr protein kinase)